MNEKHLLDLPAALKRLNALRWALRDISKHQDKAI